MAWGPRLVGGIIIFSIIVLVIGFFSDWEIEKVKNLLIWAARIIGAFLAVGTMWIASFAAISMVVKGEWPLK